jgi:2-methylisocitrate lyase-like PEP mutase family enzyme
MKTQQEKAARLVELHAGPGCFLIPNPFDAGSARVLEALGFQALASSSAGFAFTQARPDMGVTREQKMEHLRAICAAVDIPVSADLQNGFGHTPEDAAITIRQAAEAGCVGGSIEDSRGTVEDAIYDIGLANERMAAAAEAARSAGFKFSLVGRAENYLWGRKDLADTIRRLQAYQEAGADVLFAPGVTAREDIEAILKSIDRPFNVIGSSTPFTVAELEAMGVRRISVGGGLSRVALGALEAAGREMLEQGTFGFAKTAPSTKHFNDLFS